MNRVSAPGTAPSRFTGSRMAASKYSSILARSFPPSTSLILLDHRLEAYLQTRSIMASKFSSWRPPSTSPNWHHHGLQVHLQTRTITAAKCIFKLTRSQPSNVSPNSHDYGLQTRFFTASSVYFILWDDVYLPGVSQISTACRWIHLGYPSIPLRIYRET
jgi:hypothetical protein